MSTTENSVHVLVVDDDASARASAKELLMNRMLEVRVTEVASPHDALIRLSKQRYDLIVLDYELPQAGGTFMDEIARLPEEHKPFGVIVGFAKLNEIPKVGPAYFLPKPWGADDMASVIESIAHAKLAKSTWAKGDLSTSTAAPATAAGPSSGPSARVKVQAPARAAPIDVNFINPFLEGAVVVLETVCETKSVRETVFTRKDDSIRGDVSAIIAMNSSTKQGSFAITFEKKAFLAAAGRMLGETYTEVNEENRDVAGEICNQVFGYAKRKLNNEMGYDIQPAIPSIIVGDNHEIKHLINGVVLAAKFNTPEGWYLVEAAVSG